MMKNLKIILGAKHFKNKNDKIINKFGEKREKMKKS